MHMMIMIMVRIIVIMMIINAVMITTMTILLMSVIFLFFMHNDDIQIVLIAGTGKINFGGPKQHHLIDNDMLLAGTAKQLSEHYDGRISHWSHTIGH